MYDYTNFQKWNDYWYWCVGLSLFIPIILNHFATNASALSIHSQFENRHCVATLLFYVGSWDDETSSSYNQRMFSWEWRQFELRPYALLYTHAHIMYIYIHEQSTMAVTKLTWLSASGVFPHCESGQVLFRYNVGTQASWLTSSRQLFLLQQLVYDLPFLILLFLLQTLFVD